MQQPLSVLPSLVLTLRTIERAIQSAINQNWEPKEILVADDCSTDRSKEIIYQ